MLSLSNNVGRSLKSKTFLTKAIRNQYFDEEKIYDCVSPRYQSNIPKLNHVIAYLRLHWAGSLLSKKI